MPLDDFAVYRHLLAEVNADAVANLRILQRHLLFGTVLADRPDALGGKVEQRADGGARPHLGAQFEDLTARHECNDHRAG